jgi:membrane-associated phospholipid phosphatase
MVALPTTAFAVSLALGDHRGTAELSAGFALNVAATQGLKWLIDKERPNAGDGDSFPSGHSSIAFQAASFIHLRYGFPPAIPAYAAAAFVAYSRVRVQAHYPEDVLAGAAIGVLSSVLFTNRRANARQQGVQPAVVIGWSVRLR